MKQKGNGVNERDEEHEERRKEGTRRNIEIYL